eukprot:scaffold49450_cov41-Attheya_sp.AAC.1
MGRWTGIESSYLLPGDIFSLTRNKPHYAKDEDGKSKKGRGNLEDEDGDVVPADVLLLRGSTVVNEASLTGESVPQMKEGLSDFEEGEELSMKNRHKNHVLYAGTKMLQCKGIMETIAEEESSEEESEVKETSDNSKQLYGSIPPPPDQGCLCFVLRTGFSSAQGKLVRMIEGSQEKVKGHERETGLLLLLLFCFAVASSSYVLYHGLRDENRSQYELLLHCILIITSVIPPELPMQMALAVNNSLMTLMKMQVFCTEPYRVPMAGKLDACLFDKTGTLTTDELVAVGVCELKGLVADKKDKMTVEEEEKQLTPMTKVVDEAGLVLAGCHSLISIEGETTGDPLESASLNAMRWCISDTNGHVTPKVATEKKPAGKSIAVDGSSINELEVLSRHHFSSKLQRMSTVVRDCQSKKMYGVVKGSPEAVGNLLSSKPKGYDFTAKALSKRGYRVIALAYKTLSVETAESAKETRAVCEENVNFAGFIAFTCRVRKDTRDVLRRLKEGGLTVAMVTGDALLTAAHVAKEVDICDPTTPSDPLELGIEEKNEELKAFLEQKMGKKQSKTKKTAKQYKSILILEQENDGKSMYWQNYDDESRMFDFVAAKVPELAKDYDLATTGKCLAAAFEYDDGTKKILAHFKIFARMTPDAKETVIECLHSVGIMCLMCGDGANDVGALKQADVGVALLSGFGDLNVDKGEDGVKNDKKEDKGPPVTAIMSKEHLDSIRQLPVYLIKSKIRSLGTDPNKFPDIIEKDDLIQLYQIKAREVAVKRHDAKNQLDKKKLTKAEMQATMKEKTLEKQQRLAKRVAELEAQGVQWATFKAMKEYMALEMEEGKKKKATFSQNNSIEGSAATMAAQLEDLEMDELPMVKLGDASIAAPFTSKMP